MQGPHQGIGELEPTWFSCPAEEGLSFTRVYKRADRIWRTQIRANSFAAANAGGNLMVADIENSIAYL